MSIALTDEGRALRDKAFAISQDMICALRLDVDDFADLKQTLHVLTQRVNESPRGS